MSFGHFDNNTEKQIPIYTGNNEKEQQTLSCDSDLRTRHFVATVTRCTPEFRRRHWHRQRALNFVDAPTAFTPPAVDFFAPKFQFPLCLGGGYNVSTCHRSIEYCTPSERGEIKSTSFSLGRVPIFDSTSGNSNRLRQLSEPPSVIDQQRRRRPCRIPTLRLAGPALERRSDASWDRFDTLSGWNPVNSHNSRSWSSQQLSRSAIFDEPWLSRSMLQYNGLRYCRRAELVTSGAGGSCERLAAGDSDDKDRDEGGQVLLARSCWLLERAKRTGSRSSRPPVFHPKRSLVEPVRGPPAIAAIKRCVSVGSHSLRYEISDAMVANFHTTTPSEPEGRQNLDHFQDVRDCDKFKNSFGGRILPAEYRLRFFASQQSHCNYCRFEYAIFHRFRCGPTMKFSRFPVRASKMPSGPRRARLRLTGRGAWLLSGLRDRNRRLRVIVARVVKPNISRIYAPPPDACRCRAVVDAWRKRRTSTASWNLGLQGSPPYQDVSAFWQHTAGVFGVLLSLGAKCAVEATTHRSMDTALSLFLLTFMMHFVNTFILTLLNMTLGY